MNNTILKNNANHATTIGTALQNSGMDWSVEKKPLYTAEGWEIPGQFATVRSDKTGPSAVLGVVGSKYYPIQNADALGILDDFIAADPEHAPTYDSILSLSGGARVAASIDLGRPFEVVPGDTHKNYLTVVTSHDGSSGTKLMVISFRMACFNASRRAVSEAKGRGTYATISHTVSSVGRLQAVRHALVGTGHSLSTLEEGLKELATRHLRRSDVESVLRRLFPVDIEAEELPARIESKRAKFLELFESNDNGQFKLIAGTAYNAYNAFTEYVDHHDTVVRTSGKTGMLEYEIRQEKAIFGTGADSKEKALDIILDATKFAPRRQLAPSYAPQASFTSNASLLSSILAQ